MQLKQKKKTSHKHFMCILSLLAFVEYDETANSIGDIVHYRNKWDLALFSREILADRIHSGNAAKPRNKPEC